MAHYVLPQKSINYLISRNYSIGEIWTNLKNNGITYCKVLPIKEPLEMQNCWKAMGFHNTHIQVSVSPFSTPESLLDEAGLYNSNQWNEVYERIKASSKGNQYLLHINRHKPKGMNKKKGEWLARDKNAKQRKWAQFDDLYSVCQRYHLNFSFAEKQFDDKDYYAFNSGVVVKRVS